MDATWIIVIIGVLLVLAYIFFNRNRQPPPAGTYDAEDVRSGGGIGGGPSTYDDPEMRSGGSIGGKQSTYDDPDVESGGSIGGSGTATAYDHPVRDERRIVEEDDDLEIGDEEEEPRYDDPDVRSGGSFGGD